MKTKVGLCRESELQEVQLAIKVVFDKYETHNGGIVANLTFMILNKSHLHVSVKVTNFLLLLFQLQKSKEREERLEEVVQAYEKIHLEKSNVQRDLDKMVNAHLASNVFVCQDSVPAVCVSDDSS